jgi:hypothetical protein
MTTLAPNEIFPDDRPDPTIDPKKSEMPVEDTLAIVNHVRVVARKRAAWRYLAIELNEGENVNPEKTIREKYEAPDTALVVHQGNTWAVWTGEGEPTSEAFEPPLTPEEAKTFAGMFADDYDRVAAGAIFEDTDPADDHASMKASLAALGGQTPAPSTRPDPAADLHAMAGTAADDLVAGLVAKGLGGSGSALPRWPVTEHISAARVEYEKTRAERIKKELEATPRWVYAAASANETEFRARFNANPDAPVMTDSTGKIMAVWVGDVPPRRPAFQDNVLLVPAPGAASAQVPSRTPAPAPSAPPAPRKPVDTGEQPVARPEVALNKEGLRLFKLSRDPAFSVESQKALIMASNLLHAEAHRIEITMIRMNFIARKS